LNKHIRLLHQPIQKLQLCCHMLPLGMQKGKATQPRLVTNALQVLLMLGLDQA